MSRSPRAGDAPFDGPSIRSLGDLIQAFDQPAYVVTDRGVVIASNRAARSRWASAPVWVSEEVRASLEEEEQPSDIVVRRVRHQLDELALDVVVIAQERPSRPPIEFDWDRLGLSASMREVAELVAQGRSDKEIATLTGRPHPTIRTYVARILSKMGVSRRAEFAAIVHGSRVDDDPTDRSGRT